MIPLSPSSSSSSSTISLKTTTISLHQKPLFRRSSAPAVSQTSYALIIAFSTGAIILLAYASIYLLLLRRRRSRDRSSSSNSQHQRDIEAYDRALIESQSGFAGGNGDENGNGGRPLRSAAEFPLPREVGKVYIAPGGVVVDPAVSDGPGAPSRPFSFQGEPDSTGLPPRPLPVRGSSPGGGRAVVSGGNAEGDGAVDRNDGSLALPIQGGRDREERRAVEEGRLQERDVYGWYGPGDGDVPPPPPPSPSPPPPYIPRSDNVRFENFGWMREGFLA